jgi:hypothetical protein
MRDRGLEASGSSVILIKIPKGDVITNKKAPAQAEAFLENKELRTRSKISACCR